MPQVTSPVAKLVCLIQNQATRRLLWGMEGVLIKKLKAKDPKNVSFLRMDNAAENVSLKSNLEKEGLPVEVEFTSPNTPEQNGQVERSFATLWERVRAMLNDLGL